MSNLPKNKAEVVQHAINKCESLGTGKQLILHGNSSEVAKEFSPHMAVLRRHFLPNMQFECCMILQGTLGGNFDIFAASGESAAWVLLWKNRSRPIGVRLCPVAQFNFFNTTFDPRAWTMVAFWKENLGRQPQLITPENEGGGETNYPSLPKFSDVPFGPGGPPEPSELPGTPRWPPAPSLLVIKKKWNLERTHVRGYLCDLHNPSLNLFRFLSMMTTIISHHKKKDNGTVQIA